MKTTKNNPLKDKIASYAALSGAFALAGTHEAEAQVIYVDVNPDVTITANAQIDDDNLSSGNSTTGSTTSNRVIFNPVMQSFRSTGSAGNGEFSFQVNAQLRGYYWTGSTMITFPTGYSSTIISNGSTTYTTRTPSQYGTTTIEGNRFRADVSGNAGGGSSADMVGSWYVYNLDQGDTIDSDESFTGYGNLGYASVNSCGYGSASGYGPFVDYGSVQDRGKSSVTGFIGIRFNDNGDTKFGWVRVRLNLDVSEVPNEGIRPRLREDINTREIISTSSELTIMDYAYNDNGNPIRAGQGLITIPTVGQWGLVVLNLILLIFGVVAVRENKKLVIKKK